MRVSAASVRVNAASVRINAASVWFNAASMHITVALASSFVSCYSCLNTLSAESMQVCKAPRSDSLMLNVELEGIPVERGDYTLSSRITSFMVVFIGW